MGGEAAAEIERLRQELRVLAPSKWMRCSARTWPLRPLVLPACLCLRALLMVRWSRACGVSWTTRRRGLRRTRRAV